MNNVDVRYTLSLKDLMTKQLEKTSGVVQGLNRRIDQTKSGLKSLGSMTGIGSSLGIGLSAAGVVSFGKSVVESLKNYEYFSASLRTLMKGDAMAAKSLETSLISLAAKTPFSLTEVQDATKQLLAYGFGAGQVTKNISMLGDVASALKIPFSDIAYLYGTLKTQGRAYTRDIMQFTSRGIPVIKELAKQFKVTDGEVMKLVEDGKVGFNDIEKAFQSMTSSGGMFFNMMAEQSKTVGGQLSNMSDNWEQLKVNIGKSQQGIIAQTITFTNRMVDFFKRRFEESNVEEENFAKYQAKQFRGSFNPMAIFEASGKAEQQQYQRAIYDLYVNTPSETMSIAIKKQTDLTNHLNAIRRAYNQKEIDETEFSRKRATVLGALDEVKGQISLLKQTPQKAQPTAAEQAAKVDAQMAKKAVAPLHTQINVTFGKLIETQIVEVASASKDFVNKVGDMTAQALLNAINDVSRIEPIAK